MSDSLQILKLAVCLFDDVTLLDFQGAMEQFGFLAPRHILDPDSLLHVPSKIAVEAVYLAPTEDPIRPSTGPLQVPNENIRQCQGWGTVRYLVDPQRTRHISRRRAAVSHFVREETSTRGQIHAFGVHRIVGSRTGWSPPTNKTLFLKIKDATKDQRINWVAKARWVVDGNYWTSSGITAGIGMGHAFLVRLVGEEITRKITGATEVSFHGEGDDEYAAFHGLV